MKKTLLFLSVFIIIVGGCKKELDIVPENLAVDHPNLLKLLEFGGDSTGIDRNTLMVSSWLNITSFTGIKKNKIWIALYESDSKRFIKSLTTDQPSSKDIGHIYVREILNIKDNNYILSTTITNKNNGQRNGTIVLFDDKIRLISNSQYPEIQINKVGDDKFLMKVVNFDGLILCELRNLDGDLLMEEASFYKTGDSILYSGFKEDNKIWFGLYDSKNKTIGEWTSKQPLERNIKIHLGYGEYEDKYLNRMLRTYYSYEKLDIKYTNWGYLLAVNPFQNYKYTYLLVLNENICYPLVFEDGLYDFSDWYNNSFIITLNNKTEIYSMKGELLYSFEKNVSLSDLKPCSFTDYIYFSGNSYYIYRGSLTKQNLLWRTEIESLKDIPYDARKVVKVLKDDTNIWEYQVDITYYEGTKKTIKFSVNIDNGKVTIL